MENPVNGDAFLSLRRMRVWNVILTLMGAGTVAAFLDWTSAATFVAGSIASWFNFLLLHSAVMNLGTEPTQGKRRVMALFAARYIGLAIAGYATLILFGANPAVFCAGLLVAVFAMFFEATIELIYARA
jgi:hypothetical protein